MCLEVPVDIQMERISWVLVIMTVSLAQIVCVCEGEKGGGEEGVSLGWRSLLDSRGTPTSKGL